MGLAVNRDHFEGLNDKNGQQSQTNTLYHSEINIFLLPGILTHGDPVNSTPDVTDNWYQPKYNKLTIKKMLVC